MTDLPMLEDKSKRPSPPSVSTGTTEEDPAERFVREIREESKNGIDLRKAGITSVTVTRRGQKFSVTLCPDDIASTGRRIEGLRREMTVKYLLWRDGNRCAIKSPLCVMGDKPFDNPIHANIDYIEIKNPIDNHLKNLRLTCGSCNSHYQKYQWKREGAPTRAKEESERESRVGEVSRAIGWASREGEQGEKQQAYWDEYIARDDKDSPWKKLGVNKGDFVRLADLLDLTPREVGRLYTVSGQKFGSSVTYRRYAMEDRFTVLEITKDKGEWWVRFRRENRKETKTKA